MHDWGPTIEPDQVPVWDDGGSGSDDGFNIYRYHWPDIFWWLR